ncbi:hypothetical protein SA13R_08590 [Rothia kristinae]|nr:hypothetical protein SA11R_05440 [Rothia kristinae]KTR64486.1 hypothetical protein SA12R_07955 [Rothia kristinae]KTR73883.1 hypothetical protein SA15R_02680 [Rothia kristinae]KTR76261.1 hypothetical protein SA14R_07480 [Rothia kristinae]KTR79805.1 hypothetical protein RSA28_07095 [Rothia kristinae]
MDSGSGAHLRLLELSPTLRRSSAWLLRTGAASWNARSSHDPSQIFGIFYTDSRSAAAPGRHRSPGISPGPTHPDPIPERTPEGLSWAARGARMRSRTDSRIEAHHERLHARHRHRLRGSGLPDRLPGGVLREGGDGL